MLEFVMNIAPTFLFLVFYVNSSMRGKEAGGVEGSVWLPRFFHRVLFPGAALRRQAAVHCACDSCQPNLRRFVGDSGDMAHLFCGGGLGGADGGIPADDRDPDDLAGPGAAGQAPQDCDPLSPLVPLREKKRSAIGTPLFLRLGSDDVEHIPVVLHHVDVAVHAQGGDGSQEQSPGGGGHTGHDANVQGEVDDGLPILDDLDLGDVALLQDRKSVV